MAYLDDIVIFARMFEEQPRHLEDVLDKLRASGLSLNPKKKAQEAEAGISLLGFRRCLALSSNELLCTILVRHKTNMAPTLPFDTTLVVFVLLNALKLQLKWKIRYSAASYPLRSVLGRPQ